MLASAAIRLRLLDVPLDRDEGEYAYIGRLILDGVPPYERAYNMKMPGIYVIYAAALAAFGATAAGAHLGLLVANALGTVLVFLLARRWFDLVVAVGAAAIFAAASLNPELHGLGAYAEHFMLPAVLGGALVLCAALESGRPVGFATAGLLFGLAFVIKQSGGFLIAFPLTVIALEALRGRRAWSRAVRAAALVAAGAVTPFAVVCLWLSLAGTFPAFWFWTFRYAAEYATLQSAGAAARMFGSTVGYALPAAWPIVLLALAGLVAPAREPRDRRARALGALLLACSFVAASAGLYFRQQYFLLLLPALALLAARGAFAIARVIPAAAARRPAAGVVVIAVATIWALVHDASVLFRAAPHVVSRAIYGRNPFVESVEIARYIRERSGKDDRIAVIGSEPQIYFYAGRPAATGYIYMYPLMEAQPYASQMQRDMIRELEAARPKYLVFVNLRASWLATPASDSTLARWFDRYWRDFDRVGVADIVSRDVTRYVWDDAARDYTPQSSIWLAVFRRRD
ncbi:MAG: glycosyltransferase family 39 protein [Candidatus Rokubacteria bacterium]|nr:glycosyltransferase family 39 protein [Candidatus Rokubacteria bacterium]